MEPIRKPFQGTWNIIRFNRHFYLLALLFIGGILLANILITTTYSFIIYIFNAIIALTTLISLVVSFYIYDLSDVYSFNWLNKQVDNRAINIINIHAGFDETSNILSYKFPAAKLTVLDFYDPLKHTDVSIKRARKAYKPFDNTIQVVTTGLPLPDNYADNIFIVFAAHEIRIESERVAFFEEIKRVIKPGGAITVVEHLRDIPNFLAYNIGFFHFLTKRVWYKTFKSARFEVISEKRKTPFVNIFNLA